MKSTTAYLIGVGVLWGAGLLALALLWRGSTTLLPILLLLGGAGTSRVLILLAAFAFPKPFHNPISKKQPGDHYSS